MSEEIKTTMTPENFCYWLQGFFEISQAHDITSEQAMMIKRHLDLVFHKSLITYPDFQEGTGTGGIKPLYDASTTGTPPTPSPEIYC